VGGELTQEGLEAVQDIRDRLVHPK
jgi:hypothetical protein